MLEKLEGVYHWNNRRFIVSLMRMLNFLALTKLMSQCPLHCPALDLM